MGWPEPTGSLFGVLDLQKDLANLQPCLAILHLVLAFLGLPTIFAAKFLLLSVQLAPLEQQAFLPAYQT